MNIYGSLMDIFDEKNKDIVDEKNELLAQLDKYYPKKVSDFSIKHPSETSHIILQHFILLLAHICYFNSNT